MRTQTPFWPLLKNELDLGRSGGAVHAAPMLIIYWVGVGSFPFLVLFGDNSARGNIASLFEAGFLPLIAFLFLSNLIVWNTYATVPAFCELLPPAGAIPGAMQNLGAFEFLFTRAVDRRILFRARTTAFIVFALAPLFLNVAASWFAPDVGIGFADSSSAESVKRHERYLRVFPASHPVTSHPAFVPAQIVIPHGAVAYTGWLAWGGTLAFLLLQGYGTLIAGSVKPNRWWTALLPGAPIVLVLLFLILVARGSLRTHINIYENSFLLFSSHPLAMVIALAALAGVIQTWCERRFSKLEIL